MLARERWQTFENSWTQTIFNEHPISRTYSLPHSVPPFQTSSVLISRDIPAAFPHPHHVFRNHIHIKIHKMSLRLFNVACRKMVMSRCVLRKEDIALHCIVPLLHLIAFIFNQNSCGSCKSLFYKSYDSNNHSIMPVI